jgi:anti-sigma B factor antagonist
MTSFYIGDDVTMDGASDVAAVVVGGELDYETSPRLRAHLAHAIKAGGRHLIVDLSAVSFVDSTAIGVLVGAVGKLEEIGGGSLAVVCARENVLRIFQITGLDNMIPLYPSREEALTTLAMAG